MSSLSLITRTDLTGFISKRSSVRKPYLYLYRIDINECSIVHLYFMFLNRKKTLISLILNIVINGLYKFCYFVYTYT